MHFFNELKNEIVELYKLKYSKDILDDTDLNKIDEYFNKKILKRYNATYIDIMNTTIQEVGESGKKVDLVKFYDNCRNNNSIFSLSHGCYKNEKSHFIEIWADQPVRRNNVKKLMKKALENGEYLKAQKYNREIV